MESGGKLHWQGYFDGKTLDAGRRLCEAGRPDSLIGCYPYKFHAHVDGGEEYRETYEVFCELNDKTEEILEISCTCPSAQLRDIHCAHMAAALFAWEGLKNSDNWYDNCHKYKSCSSDDVAMLKQDIDDDIAERMTRVSYETEVGVNIVRFEVLEEICSKYYYGDFTELIDANCFGQVFELADYLTGKLMNLNLTDKERERFIHACAWNWEETLFRASPDEKVRINKSLEYYLTLDPKSYLCCAARETRDLQCARYSSPVYRLHRKVFDFLATVPKDKVVTCKLIRDYIGDEGLASADIMQAVNYRDPETEHLKHKVVTTRGYTSKVITGLDDETQRQRLKDDGVNITHGKVDLRKSLHKL